MAERLYSLVEIDCIVSQHLSILPRAQLFPNLFPHKSFMKQFHEFRKTVVSAPKKRERRESLTACTIYVKNEATFANPMKERFPGMENSGKFLDR